MDWYRVKGGHRQTLFYQVSRNRSFAKSAGDPAFAMIFIAILAYILSIYATYCRWAGRTPKLPVSWQATSAYYGVSSFFLFLSFVVYAGKMNASNAKPDGRYGGGFGIAIIMWLAMAVFAFLIYWRRGEVDRHTNAGAGAGAGAGGAAGVSDASGAAAPATTTIDGTNPVAYGGSSANPAPLTEVKNRWAKLKVHSIILLADLFLILLTIVALGAPWYDSKGRGTYGLLETHLRHASGSTFRKAGDAAFAFVLFAMFAQLYATIAITLRFLGRNDKFAGRLPHGLTACLVATGISSFCCFLAMCIYAGVVNDKQTSAQEGHFGGGFALIILNWLFTMVILAILHFKKAEVDNAPQPEQPPSADAMYPPAHGAAAGAPGAAMQPNPYGPHDTSYAEPQPGALGHQPQQGAPASYDAGAAGYDTSVLDTGANDKDTTV